MQIQKRNKSTAPFNSGKITQAMAKAFTAVKGKDWASSIENQQTLLDLTQLVINKLSGETGIITIEHVQDKVEEALMSSGHHDVARAYVVYRHDRQALREQQNSVAALIHVQYPNQQAPSLLNVESLRSLVKESCAGLENNCSADLVVDSIIKTLYDGVTSTELRKAVIMGARAHLEQDPDYGRLTARLLLNDLRMEVLGTVRSHAEMKTAYAVNFPTYLQEGIEAELINPELVSKFDIDALAAALDHERDFQFTYLGLQTLYDRYFLHIEGRRIELPQTFFMRVAMGLSLLEDNPTQRAIEFYRVLSSFDFMSSTPTLFNSGTLHSQMSSCYLTTVPDDLAGIFDALKDNALLSKFAGGLGNDWTPVRAMGARIKGTNGKSQGVIPFLKIVNDTAVAVNQGGKRKGAVCAYLETFHLDVEEFLELRKNTGDDRRRTHDMNSANWIPDLFMERVEAGGNWTLFSPSDVSDLHDLVGLAFKERYEHYEALAAEGKIKIFKTVEALSLWRKMLIMLFETGHPWITFKDPCNIRSPQQHVGVVHSSNLCTEITLNTSADEIAVCNLGSVNLFRHLVDGKLDQAKLRNTIHSAMRMLDNVIDLNFYPVEKAANANYRHRPVGMGIMGFQDCLLEMGIPYASQAAVEWADQAMEIVAYYAYEASNILAQQRGKYSTYDGSLWSKGILPQDSIELLAASRSLGNLECDRSHQLDWTSLRKNIELFGMRNSNCLAIAPTATISNIVGVDASIEPTYQNLYVKSNLSGEFTVINEHLVRDLKALGIWDTKMILDLKQFDGSVQQIARIPESLKRLYATAFEMDPTWLVEAAARRQKWIDQAQSLNIYMANATGKRLDALYRLAWRRGLKTTYYLRTLAATAAEKSTGVGGELQAVPTTPATEAKFCSIDNPDCEACQ